jgi:hypothetical protein
MAGNAAAGKPESPSFQTARLGIGRHDRPGAVVCVMELASMIAGERFTDRPSSVCPIIGSILRIYNDNLDDGRRADLYRYAAEAVGTRGDFQLQLKRAALAIGWARDRYMQRGRIWSRPPRAPAPDWGPDQIAVFVLGSLGRRSRNGGWPDAVHSQLLLLLDTLVETGLECRLPETLAVDAETLAVGELVEHLAEPVQDRCRDAELVV